MSKKSRDLTAFKNQFDKKLQIRQRLTAAIAALRKLGKEEWRSERELVDMAHVGCQDIGEFRKEFAAHIVTVPSNNRGSNKTIWFADPKVAAKVRQ